MADLHRRSSKTGRVERMHAEIRVVGDADGVELADLGRWLASQRGLIGRVSQVQGEIREQELSGGSLELLSVALGSGGAVSAALTSALSTWLGNRQRPIKLTLGDTTAEFPADTDPATLAQLIKAVRGENPDD